jgi:hypothetical protein
MSAYRFYVYKIVVDGLPIYVGKGTGDRMFVHGYGGHNPRVEAVLVEAKRRRASIERVVINDRLLEDEAFTLERVWIKRIGRADKRRGALLNRNNGGKGWSSARRKGWSSRHRPPTLADFNRSPCRIWARSRNSISGKRPLCN